MKLDYHVHTSFSGDCSVPMELIVQSGIRKGLKEICFTDHLDIDSTDGTEDFLLSLDAYSREIERLREKYKQDITIKMGVEVGLQPHVLEESKCFIESAPFDFVLGSMHCCQGLDFYLGDFFKEYTSEEAIRAYYEEMYLMVTQFSHYSVLGHLDIYKRYKPASMKVSLKNYQYLVEKVLKEAIKKDKGIEINTSGLRSSIRESLPGWDIIEMYKELGGRIITLGSDSHGSEMLCANFEEVLRGLTDRGIKNIYRFDRLEPVEVRINSLL
jgi:histidinol-phosphatase (PHP family)